MQLRLLMCFFGLSIEFRENIIFFLSTTLLFFEQCLHTHFSEGPKKLVFRKKIILKGRLGANLDPFLTKFWKPYHMHIRWLPGLSQSWRYKIWYNSGLLTEYATYYKIMDINYQQLQQ
ncbi:hypothetical protein PPERSA_02641 [Pseudocohnilembus persalinus]|uniref:Uncharacterized protein n=1 Tax=Pseudocohnilembus persalinus TaxID=266149 RepID=A0A0V0R5L7_PSEPJ|nr:hypothetical protein PPERSA_02641 [Pseudocohnilembus persalinus]|eukprot:KRX09769.1 hypothetical protein PPERSA_02641 [Pseudocohnilembus persalinus]